MESGLHPAFLPMPHVPPIETKSHFYSKEAATAQQTSPAYFVRGGSPLCTLVLRTRDLLLLAVKRFLTVLADGVILQDLQQPAVQLTGHL